MGKNKLPTRKRWLEKVEKDNLAIALNVLYIKKMGIFPQNIAQIVKKDILLIIPNGKWWDCLAVKKLSALLRGISSRNNGDFYCLNFLHSFRIKHKLKLQYVR